MNYGQIGNICSCGFLAPVKTISLPLDEVQHYSSPMPTPTIQKAFADTQLMLEIVNDGLNAILLIGASTKRGDDTKIGFFGSGLKYSMATLLRNGIPFKMFSGTKEIKITTKKVKLREQEFRQIVINGKPTSMTLEMGIDWQPWFAVREILCNAIDEGCRPERCSTAKSSSCATANPVSTC